MNNLNHKELKKENTRLLHTIDLQMTEIKKLNQELNEIKEKYAIIQEKTNSSETLIKRFQINLHDLTHVLHVDLYNASKEAEYITLKQNNDSNEEEKDFI